MSKRRIFHFFLAIFIPPVLVIGLYYGITGVVTLKEENRQLKVENTKIQRDSIQLDKKIDSLKGHSRTTAERYRN
jgi:cell division protein FtsL